MTHFDSVCRYVKTRNVHFDKNSLEEETGRFRNKFKLVGKPIKTLNQFIFFTCSKSDAAYHKATTIKILSGEWENRSPKYLDKLDKTTYIDVQKSQPFEAIEIAEKIMNDRNGFEYIAKLPETKFVSMRTLFLQKRYKIAKELRPLIAEAVEVEPEIMRRLGLL